MASAKGVCFVTFDQKFFTQAVDYLGNILKYCCVYPIPKNSNWTDHDGTQAYVLCFVLFCFISESSPGDANVRAGIESNLDAQLEFLNNKNM